jgi:transposase
MEGGFFMNKNEQVEYEILQDFQLGKKSRNQAATLLNISERAVSRRARKLRRQGVSGIKHGNTGRTPSNKRERSERDHVISIFRSKYFDFNIRHAHELMSADEGINVSYVCLLNWCKEAGLARTRKRRPSKARIHRERMANEGILLQMDGSHHKWNGKDEWCLISLIDDATSNIPAGQFYDGETSWNCMHLLRRLFESRGIPQFLYTDGAGWAGGGGKRQNFSQVVRACQELGIQIIRANSAEAKGRIERSYKTIQSRLIPEMRLKGVTQRLDANRYLDQVFWPDWSKRFSVTPRESTSRYRALKANEDLNEILCMKFERIVNRDHTISFDGARYRIDPARFRNLSKKTICVHQYEDKSIRIFYAGEPIDMKELKEPKRKWI